MSKRPLTFEEEVREYVVYNPCNPCWRDSWYLESLNNKYGKECVSAEIKRQEKGDYGE